MENKSTKTIQRIFSEVSSVYDAINHILTFGLDSVWRKRVAKTAAHTPQGGRWLDVCSGTGETAKYLARHAQKKGTTNIFALDFCLPMLCEAKRKPGLDTVSFCIGDAHLLPFFDNTFDCITISFATRNLNNNKTALECCLREFYRVLKPGGKFINLETSQPPSLLLRMLFHGYVRLAVKPIGYLLSGSKAAYAYLSYTIPRFFCAKELSCVIASAGFAKTSFSYMAFGISAIHTAVK